MKNKLILLLLLFFMSFFVWAEKPIKENKSAGFDRQHWKETIKGLNYTEQPKTKQKDLFDDIDLFSNMHLPSVPRSILILVVYTVGIVILLLVLYYFISRFSRGSSNRKIKSVNPDDIENEHIDDLDLPALLKNAMEQGNYKLAVRIHYLLVLKKLSDSKLIDWKKDKTNYEYILELSAWKLNKEFSFVTSIFENVWYNKYTIDKNNYLQLVPHFELLQVEIPTAGEK